MKLKFKDRECRRFLFRGLTDEGDWLQGNLMQYANLGYCYIFKCKGEGRDDDWEQVRTETVGQWTGRCDSNGHKIFEGDYLTFIADGSQKWERAWRTGVVEYDEATDGFVCKDPKRGEWMSPLRECLRECRVSGNRHAMY